MSNNRNKAGNDEKPASVPETSPPSNQQTVVDKVWNFLSSMKLGIVLLLVMAVLSIVGTVWVSKDPLTGQENFAAFYNTWFFKLLMGLLALNLLVCSLNRWKSVMSTLRGPSVEISEGFVKNLKSGNSIKLKAETGQVGEKVKQLLTQKGYRVFSKQDGDVLKISSDKGHLGIFGPYLTHLSFIIIIVAIMIKFSGLSGFEGNLAGLVGGTYSLGDVTNVQGKINPKDNFSLKVNNFRTEYRPDGSIKQWHSDVTVIDGNNTFPFDIYVNNPLVYKGIKFYQSSYGYQYSGKFTGPGAQDQKFNIAMNDYIQPQGTDITFIPIGYDERSKRIEVATYKGNQGINQELVALNTPYKYEQAEVTFENVDSYTVLSVKKDPGVPVIGVGSLLLLAGVTISFILRQRRIWSVITPDKDGSLVLIGGLSTKDKRGVDLDLEKITDELKG